MTLNKYEVYGAGAIGHLMHVIRAKTADAAETHFLRAHPGGQVVAIAVPNGVQSPAFVKGNAYLAKMRV